MKILNDHRSSLFDVPDRVHLKYRLVSLLDILDLLLKPHFHLVVQAFVVGSAWRSRWQAQLLFEADLKAAQLLN